MKDADQALNRLSLIAHTLRYLSEQIGGFGLGSTLELLADDIEGCMMLLDSKRS